MTWPVTLLLLVAFGGVGVLVGFARAARWTWPVVLVAIAIAGLLFVPVRCATGVAASPFNDVTGLAKPTGCEGLARAELPELGPLSSDTVGFGLAIAAVAFAVWTAALVAGRRTTD